MSTIPIEIADGERRGRIGTGTTANATVTGITEESGTKTMTATGRSGGANGGATTSEESGSETEVVRPVVKGSERAIGIGTENAAATEIVQRAGSVGVIATGTEDEGMFS